MIWDHVRQTAAWRSIHKLEGTRHRNFGTTPGDGVDCIQSVVLIHIAAGLCDAIRFKGYSTAAGMFGKCDKLRDAVLACWDMREVPKDKPEFGAVAFFTNGGTSSHTGFFADGQVYHVPAGSTFHATPYKAARRKIDSLWVMQSRGWKMNPNLAVKGKNERAGG